MWLSFEVFKCKNDPWRSEASVCVQVGGREERQLLRWLRNERF